MFFIKSRNRKRIELQREILNLEDQKRILEQTVDALKQEQTTEMTKAIEHFQFSIAFDKLDIFSIERLSKGGNKPHTVIGYFLTHNNGAKEVREWVLYTSAKEHNRLVVEFELWKGQKNARLV